MLSDLFRWFKSHMLKVQQLSFGARKVFRIGYQMVGINASHVKSNAYSYTLLYGGINADLIVP